MSKYLELARKIYELAKKGYEGEKEAAQAQLYKIMNKHGITIQDIEGVEIKRHVFKVTKSEMKLFNQVKYHVMGSKLTATQWYSFRSKPEVFVECTAEQAIEIEMKFNIFKRDLEKAYQAAYTAFIHVNKIFPEHDDSESDESDYELTETDRMAILMSTGIQRSNIRKQLK